MVFAREGDLVREMPTVEVDQVYWCGGLNVAPSQFYLFVIANMIVQPSKHSRKNNWSGVAGALDRARDRSRRRLPVTTRSLRPYGPVAQEGGHPRRCSPARWICAAVPRARSSQATQRPRMLAATWRTTQRTVAVRGAAGLRGCRPRPRLVAFYRRYAWYSDAVGADSTAVVAGTRR